MTGLTLRRACAGTAAVALCFALFVAAELFELRAEAADARPLDHPTLVALRATIDREPGSESIVAEIRRVELALRKRFLVAEFRIERGTWLLLAGGLVFALAGGVALAREPRPVLAARATGYDPDREPRVLSRWSLAALTVALGATAVLVPLSRDLGAGEVEAARGIWARFRGPGGLAISEERGLPLELDARDGEGRNLRWKTVTPLPGLSSPVVWNERVFLTGATENSREVYCLDALSGAILWRKPVSAGPESSQIPENIWEETGYAAPTPVTDGEHVWALFANGDVACFDFFGKEAWCRNLGLPENLYGLAASPVLAGDLLILQIDQDWGSDGPRSALYGLVARTGEERWRTIRDVESSWPTPIPLPLAESTLLFTCANPWAIAYDPATGEEVWRADCLDGDGGPSPTFSDGLAFVVNVSSPLRALRVDGEGEVTDTHVEWEVYGELPDVCSLLAKDGLVWMLSTDGVLSCLEGATGEVVYEESLEASFYASPALAGDAIYLLGRRGEVFVVGTGRTFELLATGDLGEPCDASPAFAGDRLYVRGRRHLFCFQGATP